MKFSFNKKKLQYGSASMLFVVVFVAIVIVFNIFASFLTERFSLKIDMTAEGQYSLSDESRNMLKKLENPVTIYLLSARSEMEKNEGGKRTVEMVMRYGSASGGKVRYEFVDPNKNPQFFSKYPLAKNAKLRDLVVDGPERYMVVSSSEFAYHLSGKQNKTYYQSEEKISAAILYASSPEISEAGFVTGHGETLPDALASHFEGNNFKVQQVDLLSGIPAGVTNLVISAPKADFAAEEVSVLEKYLAEAGNNLYVFWSMETPKLPVIERYLSEWGIAFADRVICDESNSYMSAGIVVSDLAESHIVDKSVQGQMYILAPEARPIVLGKPISGSIRPVAVATTRDTSYAKVVSADKTIKDYSKASEDIDGPFVTVAVSEKAVGTSLDSGYSRIAAFGSYAMALEEICAVPRALNSTFFARFTEYANPNTQIMKISPKVVSSYDLNITENGATLLRIILIGIVPAIIILAAVCIFIKRKNR